MNMLLCAVCQRRTCCSLRPAPSNSLTSASLDNWLTHSRKAKRRLLGRRSGWRLKSLHRSRMAARSHIVYLSLTMSVSLSPPLCLSVSVCLCVCLSALKPTVIAGLINVTCSRSRSRRARTPYTLRDPDVDWKGPGEGYGGGGSR